MDSVPQKSQSTAILLVHLGSPRSPDEQDVREWLGKFLMDRYVLDFPWLIRKALVSGIILRTRPKKTAAAYRSIWTEQGSPLLTHALNLAKAVAQCTDIPVAWAVRYGEPSMASVMAAMAAEGVQRLLVAPMYPQYAMSTTYSALQHAATINKRLANPMQLQTLPPFYQHDGYIQCLVDMLAPRLPTTHYLLFSYHGLPRRHLRKTDPSGQCCLQRENCCTGSSPAHATCYLHQARVTSSKVAAKLGLPPGRWRVSFQSRVGRAEWLRPYTDELLQQLPQQGIDRLLVTCPAFVADNLETLEETNIRHRKIFLEAGGARYHYSPCLNDDARWAEVLATLCSDALTAGR